MVSNPVKNCFFFSLEAGFHCDRVLVEVIRSAFVLVKIKKRGHERSHKFGGFGVGRIRMFPFFSDSAYDSVAYDLVKTRLTESQAEAEE